MIPSTAQLNVEMSKVDWQDQEKINDNLSSNDQLEDIKNRLENLL